MLTRNIGLLLTCILFTVFSCVLQVSADTEANKAIVNRLFEEVFNQGKMDSADELIAPYFIHYTSGKMDAKGIEGYKELIGSLRVAFPDLNVTVEDMIGEDNMVSTRQTYTGKHQGDLQGISPTGIEAVFTGICIFRIADGKIIEGWTEYDLLGLMLQIGVVERAPDPPYMNRQGEDFLWTAPSEVTGDPGDVEANKAIVIHLTDEVVNLKNPGVIDDLVAADFVNHDPIWSVITNLAEYKEWMAGFAADLSSRQTFDITIAEGDKVVSYWTYSWMDEYLGKQIDMTGVDILRLADGKIVERWSSKDFFTMLQNYWVTPEEPTEDYSNVFFMSLTPGLNMISLPLEPITPYTARSFAEEIGATVVIKYDEELHRFVGFGLNAPGPGFPVEGGKGYIVNVPEGGAVTFTGAAWANEPAAEAAPPLARTDSAWAFLVSGSILDGDALSATEGIYTVTVRNLRTGATVTEVTDPSCYFAAAYADLNRKAVIAVGDTVEIVVTDISGKIVSGPTVHEVTLDGIRYAVINVRLKLGHIIPAKSALLQNYPNPFNPETWIPFHLKRADSVSISIYNATGQLIRTLDLGHKDPGVYVSRSEAAYWDGRNEAGEEVASGIYFYNITAGDFSAMRKMIVNK
jgi:predicted ester cyclase